MRENCGNCRHWGEPVTNAASAPGFRWCDRIEHDSLDTPPADDVLAFTTDGERYSSVLFTRATFGCVLWERAG